MKKFRQIMSVLLSVLLVFALASCATIKKDVNKVTGSFSGKTVILHSNDVHGAIEGYAYIPALRQHFEELGANVIAVDAGDYVQGSVYVSQSKGATAIQLMNEAGYDVVGLGNHEMDFGIDTLIENAKKANFKVVSSNVTRNGKKVFNDYAVVKVGKLKVGFIGLLTPETLTKANPSGIVGVDFAYSTEELQAAAQKAINKVSKKADVVIALAHLGVDDESVMGGFDSSTVFKGLTGWDFVIDAHSHTVMTKGRENEPNIQSTGTQFANVGVIVIDEATKTIEDHYLIDTATLIGDSAVLASAKAIEAEVDAKYGSTFATTEVLLDGEKAHVRAGETNLGNLITDAMVWAVGGLEVPEDHIVAITNGGGIRATLQPGDITMSDIKTVLPFGNTLAVVYVTGAEILEALEASTFCSPETVGGFPHVAGIEFTIDANIPYDANAETYPGSTYYGPKSIKRVTITSINGKPYSATDTYAVVTNDFCAAGGDTYYAFKAAYDAKRVLLLSPALDEVVVDYVQEALGGKITAAQYGEVEGRVIYK